MSHGGQCLAAFFVKMSGLFWPVLGIGTGYRMIEHMRAKTSSQSSTVRAFYFWYSLLVFNLWVIANAMLGRGTGWDRKPIMSQNTLGEIILSEISESRPKRKPPP